MLWSIGDKITTLKNPFFLLIPCSIYLIQKNMKITLYETIDSLDPADLADNPMQSLTAYIKEVSAEILKAYPDAKIKHRNAEGNRSFSIDTYLDYPEHVEVSDTIQTIGEDVYANGNFWA